MSATKSKVLLCDASNKGDATSWLPCPGNVLAYFLHDKWLKLDHGEIPVGWVVKNHEKFSGVDKCGGFENSGLEVIKVGIEKRRWRETKHKFHPVFVWVRPCFNVSFGLHSQIFSPAYGSMGWTTTDPPGILAKGIMQYARACPMLPGCTNIVWVQPCLSPRSHTKTTNGQPYSKTSL